MKSEVSGVWMDETRDILDAVAVITGVSVASIQDPRKTKRIVIARRIAWTTMRAIGYSLEDVGVLCGGYSHTTIYAGVKQATDGEREIACRIVDGLCVRGGVSPNELLRREEVFRENCRKWRALCATDHVRRAAA